MLAMSLLKNRHLSALFTILYTFITLSGILPVRYDPATRQFRSSAWMLIHSTVVLCTFSYVYMTSGVTAISALNPLIAIVFTDLTLSSICITFALQCLNARRIVRTLNASVRLIGQLNATLLGCRADGWINDSDVIGLLLRFGCKIVLVNGMAQWALITALYNLLLLITGKRDYSAIVIVSMGYFMQTMVPNMFFAVMLASRFYYERINAAVAATLTEVHRMEETVDRSEHFRQLDFCRLSDRVDELAVQHERLTRLIGDINRVMSLQLLCSTINFFGILVIEVSLVGAFCECGSMLMMRNG